MAQGATSISRCKLSRSAERRAVSFRSLAISSCLEHQTLTLDLVVVQAQADTSARSNTSIHAVATPRREVFFIKAFLETVPWMTMRSGHDRGQFAVHFFLHFFQCFPFVFHSPP